MKNALKLSLVAGLMAAPALAQDATQSVETNGVTYNVQTWGDADNPAVVLMHGWMGTSHSWRKLAPILAEERFVIVPDMRGHGASEKPAEGYDAVTLAADIHGVLDALNIDQAHIVGHDMGALVSFTFAGTYPETALTMTYLDEPLVGYNLDDFTAYREETYGGYWHFGFNTAPGLVEILVEGKEQEFVDWFVPLMHMPNPDAVTAEDRAIYAAGLKTENGIAGSVGWYRATFETARQMRALGDAGIQVPILALGGQYGIPATYAAFERYFPDADLRGGTIPNTGHLIAEEVPDQLAGELDAFFDEVEAIAN